MSHNWLSEDWNWGYANGDAHDAAFELRSRLRSKQERQDWLEGSSMHSWGELQLCLALRIQRSVNLRRLGGKAFGPVLDAMARGDFGSGSSPTPELTQALRICLKSMGDVGGSIDSEADDTETLLQALLALDFLQDGL